MLAALCAAQFMVVLDVTIVAVALPEIQDELDFTRAGLPWVVTAYTLVFGGLLILAGRAGDLYGHRRLLVTGLAVFGTASLACALAWSAPALVVARAFQGAGAAAVSPAALALIGGTVGAGERRRQAVAWWTASAAGGGASGWLLGGLLVAGLGWRWVFLVNVPVAAAVAVAVRLLLAERRAGGPARLDVPGAVLLTAGLALLGYASTRLQEEGATGATAAVLLAAAAVLSLFVMAERRTRHPVLPLPVLGRPGLAHSVATAAALTATTTPVMFFTVLHQQQVLGVDTAAVGLRCAPFNLAVVAGAALGPRVGAVAGTWSIMGAGLLLVACLLRRAHRPTLNRGSDRCVPDPSTPLPDPTHRCRIRTSPPRHRQRQDPNPGGARRRCRGRCRPGTRSAHTTQTDCEHAVADGLGRPPVRPKPTARTGAPVLRRRTRMSVMAEQPTSRLGQQKFPVGSPSCRRGGIIPGDVDSAGYAALGVPQLPVAVSAIPRIESEHESRLRSIKIGFEPELAERSRPRSA